MHEIIDDGDLFTYPMDITDAVCVTTNGCINSKMLRGESPLVALHELEKRTNLMAIRAAFDGADEFTTDMSDYEREEDYGL